MIMKNKKKENQLYCLNKLISWKNYKQNKIAIIKKNLPSFIISIN